MSREQREKKLKLLENQAGVLMQHFDSVQIFCTRLEGRETAHYTFGGGNFLTRYGHVRAWLVKEDARNMGLHND